LTATDQERLVEFLKDWGELGDTLAYEGGERRGYTTVPAAAGTPGVLLGDVPTASEVLASGVGRYFSFEFGFDQAMLMFQPVGGMDQIPKASPGRSRATHPYRSGRLENHRQGSGVSVTYTQGGRTKVIEADYCVGAPPAEHPRQDPAQPRRRRTDRAGGDHPVVRREDRPGVQVPLVGTGSPDLRRYHRDRPGRHPHLAPFVRLPR